MPTDPQTMLICLAVLTASAVAAAVLLALRLRRGRGLELARHAAVADVGRRALRGAGADELTAEVVALVTELTPARACAVGPAGQPAAPSAHRVPLHADSVLEATGGKGMDAAARRFVESLAHVLAAAGERRRDKERIEYHEVHDALTGLPNHRLMRDRLCRALDRAARRDRSLAVLVFDIDRLTGVNEALGYDAGDALLVEASRRVLAVLRAEDTLARFSGDEFVVVCEDLDEATAVRIAERVIASLHRPFDLPQGRAIITASLGLTLASGEGDVDPLLGDAGAALARAKKAGGGQYELFDLGLRPSPQRRQRIRDALADAENRDEFALVYQPLVALSREPTLPAGGDVVVGVEALLRWRSPVEGWMSPGDFIPIAESCGTIVPVGSWAIHEACRQLARWRPMLPADCPFTVFVNLSPRQLADPALINGLLRSLDETGADPRALGLEITEGVVLADQDDVVATLELLIALGIRLAVDDFGTGYSSLEQLRRFPIDLIKIDARYVTGLERQVTNRALVSSVTGMAHELGIAVCAEGVETAAQLDVARELGCDIAQGFHLGRPAPADAVDGLLGLGRRDLRQSG